MLGPLILALGTCAGAVAASQPAAPASLAGPSAAARPLPGGAPAHALGTIELGILGGYATGTVIDPQRTPTSFTQALVRLAVHLGPTGSGAMRGNFALVAEGAGLWIDQQPRAAGGGLNLLARYTWARGRWRPLFAAGAGIVYSDEQIPPGETTRNFTPQAGVGLQVLVGERWALGGEYRFHHLSNKGRTETNPGINSHLLLFGISWFSR